MKDEAVVKINKFGKAGAVIAKIIKVFIMVGIIGLTIGAVTVICLPKNIVTFKTKSNAKIIVDVNDFFGVKITDEKTKEIEQSIMNDQSTMELNGIKFYPESAKVGGNVIEIDSASEEVTVSLKALILPMILEILSLVVIYVTMHFAWKTMAALRDCETPFAANVIENIQKLGYSFIAWAILPGITEASFESVLSGGYDFNIGINMENLLVVLIVYALVVIFKYGAKLQQESDETL